MIRSETFSVCGPIRAINADALIARDDMGFFAVADGVGSLESSARASLAAVSAALASFGRLDIRDSSDIDWHKVLKDVHRHHIEQFEETGSIPSTTLSLVNFDGYRLHFTNVGDSPIFLVMDSRIALLTREHTAVDQSQSFSNFSDLKSRDGSNLLVNAIGRSAPRPVRYAPISILGHARVILASDGLLDVLTQDELGELSAKHATAAGLKKSILALAGKRRPRDNYTGVIVDLGSESGQL